MSKFSWGLATACLIIGQSVASSAQAETTLKAYERHVEPYALFEVYGQMAQICGIRDDFWIQQLNSKLFQAKITDKDIVALEKKLSGAEMNESSKHLNDYQNEIYKFVLGKDLQSGCHTLRTMPFMNKVDKIVNDY